ncbi:MAG: hypothetical protein E6K95_08815 [Thaumarchaeota archaeon]|nr:MAG: hypothetical protein E6K95_08815 [Nitrososphaerota archaeon]
MLTKPLLFVYSELIVASPQDTLLMIGPFCTASTSAPATGTPESVVTLTNSPEASPNTMQVWPPVIVDVAVRQLKIVLVDVIELLAGLLRKRKAPGVQFSIDDE